MKIFIYNRQRDLPLSFKSVRTAVKEILAFENRKTDEVHIHFVGEEEICELHHSFFNDPSPTDCISCPIDGKEELPFHVLGEVFICPRTAIKFASTSKRQKDFYIETTLYLVHALLHLFGYDDIEENERRKMRQIEKKHLNNLIKLKYFLHK